MCIVYMCYCCINVQAEMLEHEKRVAVLLPKIGNIVAPDVPVSDDEANNQIIAQHGPQPTGNAVILASHCTNSVNNVAVDAGQAGEPQLCISESNHNDCAQASNHFPYVSVCL